MFRSKRNEEEEDKKKESRFSFLDKYSMSLGFLVIAGLLIAGELPEFNPVAYLVLGPVLVRLLFDILTKKTVGSRIIRTLHPKILTVDMVVMVGGLVALYMTGYWTLADIAPIIDVLNVIIEQIGYTIEMTDAGTANITTS